MRRLLPAAAAMTVGVMTIVASSAHAADRAFPVGGFNRIKTAGPWDVRVRTGAAPSVRAHGAVETLDRLRVEVRDGELIIDSKPGTWFASWRGGNQRMTIDVTVPGLVGASLNGPGDLRVDRVRSRNFAAALNGPGDLTIGAIEAGHIEATLRGPGNLAIAGRAATATLTLNGPGDMRTAGLTVRDATVTLRGPGDIALNATGQVQGALSGPGDIMISGGARCAISRRGPGDVHCG